MVTEAIAAARAGDRVRARDLFSRLLRSDSANAEYWVWMSSVVDTDRERIYCLESALKVDPTNREAMRGLVILGARKPSDSELAASLRIPRRQVAAVVTTRSAGAGSRATGRINWTLVGLSTIAILSVAIIAMLVGPLLGLFTPRLFAQAPTLPPVTATFTPTALLPTPTSTPLPASTRVWRTPVPTQLAQTPLAFFVPATSTPTPMLGVTPHPRYEAYDSAVTALIAGNYQDAPALHRPGAGHCPLTARRFLPEGRNLAIDGTSSRRDRPVRSGHYLESIVRGRLPWPWPGTADDRPGEVHGRL